MTSRRIVIGAAVVGAAAALFAAASPALANPNYVLTTNNPGTPNSTSGAISYTAEQATDLHLYDITGATTSLECKKSTTSANNSSVNGSLTRGAQAGPQVGTVASSKWGTATATTSAVTPGANSCTAVGGSLPVAVVGTHPWSINITGASSGSAHPPSAPVSGQVTPGSITNIQAKVYVGKTNPCTFDVGGKSANNVYTGTVTKGSVVGTYTNSTSTGTLTVATTGANLYAWNVSPSSGCAGGAVNNGDQFTFGGASATSAASYAVSATSPATNAIWIDS